MKIRVLFYKANYLDKSLIDDGISIWTTAVNVVGLLFKPKALWQVLMRRYSHCSLWWADEDGRFNHNQHLVLNELDPINPPIGVPDVYANVDHFHGDCFTSTMRGDDNGTVIRSASKVLTHPERWDYVEIEIADEAFDKAKGWAYLQSNTNKGYNMRTALDFINPFRRTRKVHSDEKSICSVAVQGSLWQAGLFDRWMIWSPIRLWYKLYKMGYETKSLKGE